MKIQLFFMIFMIFGICNPCMGEGPNQAPIRRIVPCSPELGSPDFSVSSDAFPCIINGNIQYGLPADGETGIATMEDSVVQGDQGVPVEDPDRLLEIKGYSDLDYGKLEEVLDERVKSLTQITVESMERGECNVAGILPLTRELPDHDIKCYFMDFSGMFAEGTLRGQRETFACNVIIFAGDRLNANLLLQECKNDEYTVNFGKEPDGSKNNVIYLESLDLISMATRREVIQ